MKKRAMGGRRGRWTAMQLISTATANQATALDASPTNNQWQNLTALSPSTSHTALPVLHRTSSRGDGLLADFLRVFCSCYVSFSLSLSAVILMPLFVSCSQE